MVSMVVSVVVGVTVNHSQHPLQMLGGAGGTGGRSLTWLSPEGGKSRHPTTSEHHLDQPQDDYQRDDDPEDLDDLGRDRQADDITQYPDDQIDHQRENAHIDQERD